MKLLLLTVVPYQAQKLRMERIFLNIWRKKFRGKSERFKKSYRQNGRNGYWDLRKQAVKMVICNEMYG